MVPVPQQISETKNINNTEDIHRKIAKKIMTTRTQLWVICSMNQFLWQYFDQYLVALLVVNIIRMRTPLQHSEHNISH